jgi:DNA-binding CsgD family transcriptional regulator
VPERSLVTTGRTADEALTHKERSRFHPATPAEPRSASDDREDEGRDGDRAFAGLSLREGVVLRLIAAGHSNADIAQTLYISPRTASTQAARILAKLGLSTRSELIAFAHRVRGLPD